MTFKEWLEAEHGRGVAIAAHFGLHKSGITQWKNKGVPVKYMKAVRDYTRGEVTLDEMVPPAKV